MTMHLIENKSNKLFIKKQDIAIIDPTKIEYTKDITKAQAFNDLRMALANVRVLNKLMATNEFIVNQPFKSYKEEAEYFEGNSDPKVYKAWYNYDIARYPKPSVTVDLIALRYSKTMKRLQILLVQRKHWPFKGSWAMPGGFVDYEESIDKAVTRETKEETNVDLTNEIIIRMPAVSKPGRDPRTWVITNPNIVLFGPNTNVNVQAGDDAKSASWFTVKLEHNKLVLPVELAFDHRDIITRALLSLKKDFESDNLPRVTTLLGHKFTIKELKTLFSQFDNKYSEVNNSNLARLYRKQLFKTDETQTGDVGRPDSLYTCSMKPVNLLNKKPKTRKRKNSVDELLNRFQKEKIQDDSISKCISQVGNRIRILS